MPEGLFIKNEALLPLAMLIIGGTVASVLVAKKQWRSVGRLPFVGSAGVALLGLYILVVQWPRLATPPFPANPIPRTAESVARGRQYYHESCVSCHGPSGKGDGPLARGLAKKPPDLNQHVDDHPDGQLFLWIANGIPGTPMLAWGGQYTPEEIWDLVNYLRATFTSRRQ